MDEVKEIILESLKAWKNYKKRNARWSCEGVTRGSRNAQDTSNVYSQLSGLEDVVFNDFIKDDFIPDMVMHKSCQVLYLFLILYPGDRGTQLERDALDFSGAPRNRGGSWPFVILKLGALSYSRAVNALAILVVFQPQLITNASSSSAQKALRNEGSTRP